jgi:hypothetical protein
LLPDPPEDIVGQRPGGGETQVMEGGGWG